MLRELLALDDAIAAALSSAGESSLIVVAGKQSLGGFRLNGYPFRNDKGVAIVGINSQGIPSLTWSTGPGSQAGAAEGRNEPPAVTVPLAVGVAEDGIVAGVGADTEKLQGFGDNTQIFPVISENL